MNRRLASIPCLALSLVLGCSSTESATDPPVELNDGGTDLGASDGAVHGDSGDGRDGTGVDAAHDVAQDPHTDPVADQAADVPAESSGPTMNFYFGNFHSHTGFSEGEGAPQDNWEWARDVVGLDFMGVTDHCEQLSSGEWDDLASQADAVTQNGVFVALRGFEWSHPLLGHSCVFTTDGRAPAYYYPLLSMFYDWLDENNALSQFNHPGRESGVFGDLEYDSKVADNFFAIEVGNKGDGITEGEYLPYYATALDLGWRVAPTANQDNHEMAMNSHRSVFVGPELSREGLLEAMRARRIYATEDPNMRVTFRAGDVWMGSSIAPSAGSVFTVIVDDDEPIVLVELVSNGGTVVDSFTPPADATHVEWEPAIPMAVTKWYYLKVTAADLLDGEPPVQKAVTAPIWVQ